MWCQLLISIAALSQTIEATDASSSPAAAAGAHFMNNFDAKDAIVAFAIIRVIAPRTAKRSADFLPLKHQQNTRIPTYLCNEKRKDSCIDTQRRFFLSSTVFAQLAFPIGFQSSEGAHAEVTQKRSLQTQSSLNAVGLFPNEKESQTGKSGFDGIQKNIETLESVYDPKLRNYSFPNWRGTALAGPLSLSESFELLTRGGKNEQSYSYGLNDNELTFEMGKWPDPILRHRSSNIPPTVFQNPSHLKQLQFIAQTLKNTARKEGAVGLAAQQCGIDASLIFIDGIDAEYDSDRKFGDRWLKSSLEKTASRVLSGEGNSRQNAVHHKAGHQSAKRNEDHGIFLVNPRIVSRSSESEMLVWTEQCLVLPPEFRATLLRDAQVIIEYEYLDCSADESKCGATRLITLCGELARCAQHEMDHDQGILIVDHVSLYELLCDGRSYFMADIENSDGMHERRMADAYSRGIVSESSTISHGFQSRTHHVSNVECDYRKRRNWLVPSANALGDETSYLNPGIKETMHKSTHTLEALQSQPPTHSGCDQLCIEERKRVIEQRRAMMKQSRSSTKREDVLELSQQRAFLYGTTFKGLPPTYCSGGSSGICF